MKHLSFFFAWRYLRTSHKESSIRSMIRICFLGITIGSAALALVSSIMNGFEYATHHTLQGIHAHLVMHADGEPLALDQIAPILESEFPEIKAWSPLDTQHVIIQTEDSEDINSIIILKGIDAKKEQYTTSLSKKIINPIGATLSDIISNNQILIGSKLATQLRVSPGSSLSLLFTPDQQTRNRKIVFEEYETIIGGMFTSGIDEYDAGVAFCSLDMMQSLFPASAITEIEISLHDTTQEQKVIKKLSERFTLNVYSWKDQYPALVAALKLEKYAMGLILTLIAIVASMNIISLLFMIIMQKRSDIAILQVMGMRQQSLERIFIAIGTLLTMCATTFGLCIAYILGYLLDTYPIIELPDIYYVSHLPIKMDLSVFATVWILVIAIGYITTHIATRTTRRIHITNVLRFDR